MKAIELFGPPDVWRPHPDPRHRSSLEYGRGTLTFGFDAGDRLTFIAVGKGGAPLELWGQDPFAIARHPPNAHSSLKQWLEQMGQRARPHQDSFGGSFEVPDAGVVFCFSPEEPGLLAGIQLVDAGFP